MQIIAEPAAGVTGRFALVERFFTTHFDLFDRDFGLDEFVEINDTRAIFTTSDNGYGDAFVRFDDGTAAYVRARLLDRAELEQVVTALTPRTGDAAATGFDQTGNEFQVNASYGTAQIPATSNS